MVPLSITHPDLAKEADGWDPQDFRSGSNKIVAWKCPIGHSYACAISKRTYRTDGCPFCSNSRLLKGFNDLKTKFPDLADQAFEWDPSETKFNEMRTLRTWKCSEGHIWKASNNTRINGGGCHVCQGDKVVPGVNDFLTTHPKLGLEINGWDGSRFTYGSDTRQEWKCKDGHVWTATIASRSAGSGCPYCSNKKVLPGINDLQTRYPQIAAEAFGWDPSSVFPFSNLQRDWQCPLGHIYRDTPNHRTVRTTGCHYCSSHKVLVGFNDLLSTNPELAQEAHNWDPATVTSGSNKKREWKCNQGHIWTATIASRRISGCPTCTKYGFDPNKDGYFYLVEHLGWEMLQIGITNYLDYRLSSHARLGWLPLEVRGPIDGHLTQQWETAILRMLKAKGADLSNKKIAGKFDGYSEAWSKSTFEVKSIKELMRLTEEFEEK
ncbi:Probable Zinc-ribbon domain containing protein [Candidatus Nanopelagicaceae bacterium]